MQTDVTAKKQTAGMTFGQAIENLKEGKLVSRSGWNGKGMFLFIRPEFFCNRDSFEQIKSIPDNARNKIASLLGQHQYRFTGYLCMFAADGSIVNGWLASQTDMISEDWGVVE